jgi:hypothetical protein
MALEMQDQEPIISEPAVKVPLPSFYNTLIVKVFLMGFNFLKSNIPKHQK